MLGEVLKTMGVLLPDSLQYSRDPIGARNTRSIQSGRFALSVCGAPTFVESVPNPPICTVLSRFTASRRIRELLPAIGSGVHFPVAGIRSILTSFPPRLTDTIRS